MRPFALYSSGILLFWHLCWRVFFAGIITQSGFESNWPAFYAFGFLSDLTFIAVFCVLLCSLFYFSPRLAKFFFYVLLFLTAIFLVFISGYFQIFEKPAEFATVGTGLGSIKSEFFHSAIKEISPEIAWFAAGLFASWGFFLAAGMNTRPAKLRLLGTGILLPVICLMTALGALSPPGPLPQGKPGWQGGERTNPVIYALEKYLSRKNIPDSGGAANATDESWDSSSVLNPSAFGATAVKRKRYNIIFYIMESVASRYTDLSVKGKSVMPVFNALKENAFVATKHYTHFPLSVNARYNALMSAYNPLNKNWIPLSEPNFPAATVFEVFKDAGYKTGIVHTASLENWNYSAFLKSRRLDLQVDLRSLNSGKFKPTTGFSVDDRAFIEPALSFIAASRDQPWFLTFIPVMPHHPYSMPFPEFELYSNREIEQGASRHERLLRQYINSLHYADACLGELMKSLKQSGTLDNTVIFVFADHGEAFYQHPGNYLHALQLYEENVSVPFLIYNRQLFVKSTAYRGVSNHIDIAPTALDLVGIRRPESFTGVSLLRAHRARLAYFHTDWETDISGIRDGNFKYIHRLAEQKDELYDLSLDPEEQNNLSTSRPEIAALLKTQALKGRERQRSWYLAHRIKK